MNDLLITRLVCLFALLFGTVVFGLLPLYVRNRLKCDSAGGNCDPNCRCKKGKRITAFLIFFGGGVLLGTTFLHLLPEAREGFEDDDVKNCTADNSTDDGGDGEDHETFSIPEFIVCCGFFAVYLFEEIVHHFLPGGHSHVPCETPTINSNYGTCKTTDDASSRLPESGQVVTDPRVSLVGDDPETPIPAMTIGAILTFAALSFHSFFEGFAVGLRPDAISTLIVFIAISIHKFVLAFVIGLQYVAECTNKLRKHLFTCVAVFALMSPIGMAIAMVTEVSVEDSNPLTVSVLNAIATGTLVYVTFFEILRGHENKDLSSWGKFIATTLGFITLALIQFGSTFA